MAAEQKMFDCERNIYFNALVIDKCCAVIAGHLPNFSSVQKQLPLFRIV